jgi:branched-chain amino acid transport system permease protein
MKIRHRIAVLAILAIALLAAPWGLDEFSLKLATRMLIFGVAAMGVDLLVGFAGLVPLGHAAFLGLGAYAAGILTDAGYESAFVVWPLAVIVGALGAALIGALSLRSSGLYFIMITLAFAQMIYYVFQSLRAYGGDDGFALVRNTFGGWIEPYDSRSFYFVTLAIAVCVFVFLTRVVASPFGVALRAARDNDQRFAAVGSPAFGYRLVAFTLSGALCALAGVLLANLTGYITPGYGSWPQSGELLMMVLLGTAGTIWGGLLGAAIFVALSEVLSEFSDHWMFYLGLLIVLRVLLAGNETRALMRRLKLGKRGDG